MDREDFQAKLDRLSPRCHEVLNLMAQGKTNKEIAFVLPKHDGQTGEHIAESTVKGYVEDILRTLEVASRTEAAVLWAMFAGELPPADAAVQ